MNRIQMSEEEFLKKILAGEKNFDNIDMLQCDLLRNGSFKEVDAVLTKRYRCHDYEPLSFNNACLLNFCAPRIHLAKAKLHGVCLDGAQLYSADFTEADLTKAYLEEINFSYANFYEANLSGANVSRSYFWAANFAMADLRNVHGLESVTGLESVNLYRTSVSTIPAAVLQERALRNRDYLLEAESFSEKQNP